MSKESDNYATPSWIINLFKDWFDPCPLDPNWEKDGLQTFWKDKTYINPPYSNPLPWVERAIMMNKDYGFQIALLLKLDCSTKWYRLLVEADAHFLFINERVKFNGKAPPFPNVLVILDSSENTVNKNNSPTEQTNGFGSREGLELSARRNKTAPEDTSKSKKNKKGWGRSYGY